MYGRRCRQKPYSSSDFCKYHNKPKYREKHKKWVEENFQALKKYGWSMVYVPGEMTPPPVWGQTKLTPAQFAEQGKVAVRNVRKDGMDKIKRLKQDGISEDDEKFWADEVQELTDDYIKKIDEMLSQKENEIRQV